MAKRVLILDDDKDFNALLSDVFRQGEYATVAYQEASDALTALKAETFDLVVTDHKMPVITGLEFYRSAKKQGTCPPTLVVSGYLDNDTIRSYINEGVHGIFLKPLNIFSLLKKTEQILAEADSANADSTQGPTDQLSFGERLVNFPFASFACISQRSADFANRLNSLHGFKQNLLLNGPDGIDYLKIVEDIVSLGGRAEEAAELPQGSLERPEEIRNLLIGMRNREVEHATLLVRGLEKINADTRQILFDLAKGQGPFADCGLIPRLVFRLPEELDSLYDAGRVDEVLYLFLGTSEVEVPALSECPEDIPALAQAYLDAEATRGQTAAILDHSAADVLRQEALPGNHEDLRAWMHAVAETFAGQTITQSELDATGGSPGTNTIEEEQPLEDCLVEARDAYARAVLILCDGDIDEAATQLKVGQDLVAALATG